MNLLLINPNITEAVTDIMLTEARRVAAPGTTVTGITAPFGTAYVENRAESAIAAHAVLDVLASHGDGHDGIIVSAFGDPGLYAARELADVPVVGIAESALLTAWMLGRRIAIVCMTERLCTWYEECVGEHGLDGRLVAVRSVDEPVTDIGRAREELREPLRALCQRSIVEDRAEVVILAGGPIAGLARELGPRMEVPVLDGVSCAVPMLETLLRLGIRAPVHGSFARPRPKDASGLSDALTHRIQGD